MAVQRSDLAALWNEIGRLWAENRLLREKVATTWELGRPEGVTVYNNANIEIPTGEWYVLPFNSERRDDAGFHSTTSNTSRLTVPAGKAGWYTISGHVSFDANAMGNKRGIAVGLNEAVWLAIHSAAPMAAFRTHRSIATPYYLSAGNFVELYVYQDSGGNLDIWTGGAYSPEFRMVLVR